MKFFLSLTLPVLLVGCAITPQDKEAARQAELEKEARQNFYALKAQQHPHSPSESASAPAPAPTPHFLGFMDTPRQPTPKPLPPKPSAWNGLFARKSTPPSPPRDDTVYYWQVQGSHGSRYTAAELRYARELAKSPENLTPEERTWAREHY
jgi:hypothetical protein